MMPTLQIDMSRWRFAASQLYRTSSRSMADFTNGQALKVAIESVRQTKKADREKIASELGVIGREVKFKSGRKGIRVVKGKSIIRYDSFAVRILVTRFRKLKEWGVKGETMLERIRNFILARQRSVSFIASGWIPARKILFRIVRQKAPGTSSAFAGAKQYGQEKGSAKPAVFRLGLIFAEIKNTALLTTSKGKSPAPGGDPMPTAVSGLQSAINVATIDMMETLARRLSRDLEKFNGR